MIGLEGSTTNRAGVCVRCMWVSGAFETWLKQHLLWTLAVETVASMFVRLVFPSGTEVHQ